MEATMKFTLPKRKIEIKPILDRPRGVIKSKDHEAYFLIGDSSVEYCVMKDRTGKLVSPLDTAEREFFENKAQSGLTFEQGDLSPYGAHMKFADKKGRPRNYWNTREAKVKLTKRGLSLDLSDPMDYLKYKILLTNSDEIAPSWADRLKKATYRFAIVDNEEIVETKLNKSARKREAYKFLDRVEGNPEKMRNILLAFGKNPAKTTKSAFMLSELEGLIEEDADKFMNIVGDTRFEMKSLITNAVNKGIIRKSGNKYYLKSGDPMALAGDMNDMKGACDFLSSTGNQDVLMTIEAQLDDSKRDEV